MVGIHKLLSIISLAGLQREYLIWQKPNNKDFNKCLDIFHIFKEIKFARLAKF
jgi:hypothetical protein